MDLKQIQQEQQENQKQLRQLQNHQTSLLKNQKDTGRKARTRRLIERGAILESVFPAVCDLDNEQVKDFLIRLANGADARELLRGTQRRQDGGSVISFKKCALIYHAQHGSAFSEGPCAGNVPVFQTGRGEAPNESVAF
jgi:hypothetical protein